MSTLKIQKLEKKLAKANEVIDALRVIGQMENDHLNKNWSKKFDMIVVMFKVQLEEAGTITEARKWFKEWTDDVNAIDADSDSADIIEKHGFEFELCPKIVDTSDMLVGLDKDPTHRQLSKKVARHQDVTQ